MGGGAGGGGGARSGQVVGPKASRAKTGVAMEQQKARTGAYQEIYDRQVAADKGMVVPSLAAIGIKTMGTISRNAQKAALRAGGTPVQDERGRTVGVVSQGRFGKTYTGQADYDPIGRGYDLTKDVIVSSRRDERQGGGQEKAPAPAPAPEPEQEIVSPSEMLPGETPEQYRRRTRRLGGGSVLEGGGVLYK